MAGPCLLDLFSCAGGAGYGYHLAGFEVTGIDHNRQPRYPFRHIVADAIEYLLEHGHEYDVIHASPPCQLFSHAQIIRQNEHPDLLGPTRDALIALGKPWVIENVPGAPMPGAVLLCGAMFPGLRVYRHRLFESSEPLWAPPDPPHIARQNKMGRAPVEGEFIHVVGNFIGVEYAKKAMGIDWMRRRELREAIPPAFTEFIGRQLLERAQWETRTQPTSLPRSTDGLTSAVSWRSAA